MRSKPFNQSLPPCLRASVVCSRRSTPARGNTLVLVMGILVLLVIIATAYVSRTGAGRVAATASQNVGLKQDGVTNIRDSLAQEIADSLFPRLINLVPNDPLQIVSSNALLIPSFPDSVRYGQDPSFPYNFAPYHVTPFTNWPDTVGGSGLNPLDWPPGPGNPNGPTARPLVDEGNPIGFPGFGDTRWQRSFEPSKWDTDNGSSFPADGVLDAYSHWPHLSNLARANNGWRVVCGIDDVEGVNSGTGVVTDLEIPIEQWLAQRPLMHSDVTGDAVFPNPTFFENQWRNWFGFSGSQAPFNNVVGLQAYANVYDDPSLMPTNLWCLRDLDGDGIYHEVNQERPQDEFVPGTMRWNVCRFLADTDGDGYTDAFWHLAPTTVQNGIRQIVAISIVDNQSMLNGTVATRFFRSDNDFSGAPVRTLGMTPTDLALVGQLFDGVDMNNWNVGYMDNPEHDFLPQHPVTYVGWPGGGPRFDYYADHWDRFLTSVGLRNAFGYPLTQFERMDYWLRTASNPLSMDHAGDYSPFDLSNEIELRMYWGNNYPWIYSRFEFAVQPEMASAGPVAPANTGENFLRGNSAYEESSEYRDQLNNRSLVADKRKYLTMYNSVRNDLMPPWLWVLGFGQDLDGDTDYDQFDEAIAVRGSQKFDLRMTWGAPVVGNFDLTVYDNAGIPVLTNQASGYARYDRAGATIGISFRDRMELALMDVDNPAYTTNRGTYFGPATGNQVEKTTDLAAALGANFIQQRDQERPGTLPNCSLFTRIDEVAYLSDAVPISPSPTVPNPDTLMLGIEPQPFIVEAFVAHAYRFIPVVPITDPDGQTYANANEYMAFNDLVGTVIAVQIANPFNVPINLRNYKLQAFGQTMDLDSLSVQPGEPGSNAPCPLWLEPATNNKPTTAIFYAVSPAVYTDSNFGAKWVDFFDVDIDGVDNLPNTFDDDLVPDSIVRNVTGIPATTNTWSVERSVYDSDTSEGSIVLTRTTPIDPTVDPTNPANLSDVIVDRIDPPGDREFGDAVKDMGRVTNSINEAFNGPIVMGQLPGVYDIITNLEPYPGATSTLTVDGREYWVQWVRAVRPWGVDLNRDYVYDNNEKNPRFVFGDRAVVKPEDNGDGSYFDMFDNSSDESPGNRFRLAANPDDVVNSALAQGWFSRAYRRADNVLADNVTVDPNPNAGSAVVAFRKPTFFDMNGKLDPVRLPLVANAPPIWSYPDKGWYGQKDGSEFSPDGQVNLGANNLADVPTDFSMQLLQKEADFEQVGELLNLWIYAHKIQWDNSQDPPILRTIKTFSEYMSSDNLSSSEFHVRVGRLDLGAVVGVGDTDPLNGLSDPRHAIPDLPAGVRVFDGFVCDDLGIDPGTDLVNDPPTRDYDNSGAINAADVTWRLSLRPYNAKGFDGTGTPGLINLSAPVEVMRSLPNFYRLVHEVGGDISDPLNFPFYTNYIGAPQPLVTTNQSPTTARDPRVLLAEALVHYRERLNGTDDETTPWVDYTGILNGPDYSQRGGLHTDRGVVSIGEMLALNALGQDVSWFPPVPPPMPTTADYDFVFLGQWALDMGTTRQPFNQAVGMPYWDGPPQPAGNPPRKPNSMTISTDTNDEFNVDCDGDGIVDAVQIGLMPALDQNKDGILDGCQGTGILSTHIPVRPDTVVSDNEEGTMLFAGASNLITTRSDTFTVYFRVRSFRQNPSGPNGQPVWDATNPEYIVDDSRYVMLVDRSTVNHPGQKPRILYMEKLPK